MDFMAFIKTIIARFRSIVTAIVNFIKGIKPTDPDDVPAEDESVSAV